MKRLCLYPLLLDALQKALHGAPDERIRPRWERKIASAVESMAPVTATVNSKVREAEERLKMLELHERLRGAVALAPHRSFVMEKDVKCAKRSLRRGSFTDFAPKEYRLLLLTDRLLLARPEKFNEKYLNLKAEFTLGALKLAWETPGSEKKGLRDGSIDGRESFEELKAPEPERAKSMTPHRPAPAALDRGRSRSEFKQSDRGSAVLLDASPLPTSTAARRCRRPAARRRARRRAHRRARRRRRRRRAPPASRRR